MSQRIHCFLVCLLAICGGLTAAEQAQPIDIGTDKILLVDERFLAKSEGVRLKLHPPRKTGERILVSEFPWENATLNWFSVLRDGKKFRMWYECYDVEGWPTADDTSLCYAESDDGIHWSRPKLGLFSYHGSKENNILFRQIGERNFRSRVHGSGVFLDPTAPPEARYKCVSQGLFQGIGERPYYVAGMSSPDGLTWHRNPEPICFVFADSQYSWFWDSELHRYVLFGRVSSSRGRAVGRSVSQRFDHFDPLSLVLESDEGHPDQSDLYNPACFPYRGSAKLYLMFPSLFQHQPDTLDIRFSVSRDGEHWTWPDLETPFIPLGQSGDFDSGSLYMANGCLEVGDELWFYFSGSPLKHEETSLEKLADPGNRRVYSRAIAQRDRLVSVSTIAVKGEIESALLRVMGNRLIVNGRTQSGGSIRIGVLDAQGNPLPGYSIRDCQPLTGDRSDWVVQWEDGESSITWGDQPIRLRLELQNAELFGFQFQDQSHQP